MARKADMVLNDTLNTEAETEENVVNETTEDAVESAKAQDDVVDIDLSTTRKKKFRIDGDNDRVLELNVSDMSIFSRVKEMYPKLIKKAGEASIKMSEDDTEFTDDENVLESEALASTVDTLAEIDKDMREGLDYIFNSNVSELCAPDGSMYDPFNGKFRFEHILETLSALYENNLNAEIKKMTKRVNKHTSKYTKKK